MNSLRALFNNTLLTEFLYNNVNKKFSKRYLIPETFFSVNAGEILVDTPDSRGRTGVMSDSHQLKIFLGVLLRRKWKVFGNYNCIHPYTVHAYTSPWEKERTILTVNRPLPPLFNWTPSLYGEVETPFTLPHSSRRRIGRRTGTPARPPILLDPTQVGDVIYRNF